MENFKKLGINSIILDALKKMGYETPTEIQEKTIPLIINGKDVIAGSATGSGKTFAFAAGIIQNAEKGKGVQALILTPTRELAEQVTGEFRKFSKFKPLLITSVYGGVSINPQIADLHRTEIVVGTPGRILDHLERRTLDLSRLKTLVLDEADRMVDMGFIDDIKRIISQCPKKKQTLLFSATIHSKAVNMMQKHLISPVKVSVKDMVDPKKLKQSFYNVPQHLKFSLLVHLLKHETKDLVMIFCNTKRNADFIAKNLRKAGIEANAIHGGLTQAKRNSVMKCFHSAKICVLVCTDVAARGLDIPDVSHIYNYDIPNDPKEYIHRIGRTARAGKNGKVLNILSQRDHDNFRRVCSDNYLNIAEEPLPKVEMVAVQKSESGRHGSFSRFGRAGPSRGRFDSQRSFPRKRNELGRSFQNRDDSKKGHGFKSSRKNFSRKRGFERPRERPRSN